MQFKIKAQVLLDGLKKVVGVASGNKVSEVLNGALLEVKNQKLRLVGTDTEMRIETLVECEVLKEGKLILPCQRLTSVIGTFDKELTISVTDLTAEISDGKSKIKLRGIDAEKFPEQNINKEIKPIILSSDILIKGLEKTIGSVNKIEGQVLSGVCINIKENIIRFCGADGSRMSMLQQSIDFNGAEEVVIAASTAREVLKLIKSGEEVKICIGFGNIVFDLGHTTIFSGIMSTKYFDYKQLIPKNNTNKLSLDKQVLMLIIERVKTLVDPNQWNIMQFELNPKGLHNLAIKFESVNGELDEQVACSYNGSKLVIGLNHNLLLDGLRHAEGPIVYMTMSNDVGLVTVTGSSNKDDYMYLLAPMKK